MEITYIKHSLLHFRNLPSITCTAMVIALAGFSLTAQAGKISSMPSASGAAGFGGWNLDNVTVNVTGGSFDKNTGAYTIGDGTYSSDVDNVAGTVMTTILAKDYPVGEPPGIKVINDDLAVKATKPQNCIMATSYLEGHYLDTSDPQQVICSSGFQTHKRFKEAMLPAMVTGGNQGADLVFNIEGEAGSRDYQVFQKINNWTDARLQGFKIEVGFGVGASFQTASAANVNLADLSLSVPATVWGPGQLATFSHGLFGAPDKHFPDPGFFDNTSAGYTIQEYPADPGTTDTLNSGAMLAGNYRDVPPGAESATDQFGPWLPNIWLPQGIFFDVDANPATDDELVAWYGYNPATGGFGWMSGSSDGFLAIPDTVINGWSADLLYSMDVIDDLVNVGLNYIVSVGDVSTFPVSANNTFTIRITPLQDTSGTGAPAFVGVSPIPPLTFSSPTGVITLNPSPTFQVGDMLTVRVGDADENDPAVVDTLVVDATTTGLSMPVTLTEEGVDRGVFVAPLPVEFSNVASGSVVTVTYSDADDGTGNPAQVSATSTATDVIIPTYVEIDSLKVPGTIFIGATKRVTVTVTNDSDAPDTAAGLLTVTANGVVEDQFGFNLDPSKKAKFIINWTAPDIAQIVDWVATVTLDNGDNVIPATAMTEVRVKGRPQ